MGNKKKSKKKNVQVKCAKCGNERSLSVVDYRKSGMCYYCYRDICEELKQAHEGCIICKFDKFLHVHHYKPLSRGGKHDMCNIILLCPNHHAMVHHGYSVTTCMKYFNNHEKRKPSDDKDYINSSTDDIEF